MLIRLKLVGLLEQDAHSRWDVHCSRAPHLGSQRPLATNKGVGGRAFGGQAEWHRSSQRFTVLKKNLPRSY